MGSESKITPFRCGLRLRSLLLGAVCLLSLLNVGCSDLTSALDGTSSLTVGMTGVEIAPVSPHGNNDPIFETYTLETIILTKSDGTTVDAYSGTAKTFRIVDRPQILATFSLGSYTKVTFNSIAVTFSNAVIGGGRYSSTVGFTLPQPVQTYAVPFTVTSDKAERLDINLNWENTLYEVDSTKTDILQAPDFDLELNKN